MAVKEITKINKFHISKLMFFINLFPSHDEDGRSAHLYFLFGDLNFFSGSGNSKNIFLSQTNIPQKAGNFLGKGFQSCRNAAKMFCKCIKVQLG